MALSVQAVKLISCIEECPLASSIVEFSLDFFKETVRSSGNKNVFVSPSSVYVVMAMLRAGARNRCAKDMTSSLKLDKMDAATLETRMAIFVSELMKGSAHVQLNAANKIYPNTDKRILESYISLVKKQFATEIKALDFRTNAEGCRHEINTWVEEQTQQKIKDLLPSGSITTDTGMVVVNAIYFKGDWLTPFQARDTSKRAFHTGKTESAQVDMMHKEIENVRYREIPDLKCKVLELAYKGKELGMVVILPDEHDGLEALESKLNLGNLQSILRNASFEKVNVALPKFKMEASFKLRPILSALGMSDIFDPAKADFTGMADDIFVSEVFHKAFVDVNEQGTESAAGTGGTTSRSAMPTKVLQFVADHPFLFMIWDHRTDVPLFMGRYVAPN